MTMLTRKMTMISSQAPLAIVVMMMTMITMSMLSGKMMISLQCTIFAGASCNATEGETGGSRCNSRLHPKPASSQTGELLGKNYACSEINEVYWGPPLKPVSFFVEEKICLFQNSCPTWQSLSLLIGSLH